jgi:hypothetical protein
MVCWDDFFGSAPSWDGSAPDANGFSDGALIEGGRPSTRPTTRRSEELEMQHQSTKSSSANDSMLVCDLPMQQTVSDRSFEDCRHNVDSMIGHASDRADVADHITQSRSKRNLRQEQQGRQSSEEEITRAVYDMTRRARDKACDLEEHVDDLKRQASAALIQAHHFQAQYNPKNVFDTGSEHGSRRGTKEYMRRSRTSTLTSCEVTPMKPKAREKSARLPWVAVHTTQIPTPRKLRERLALSAYRMPPSQGVHDARSPRSKFSQSRQHAALRVASQLTAQEFVFPCRRLFPELSSA